MAKPIHAFTTVHSGLTNVLKSKVSVGLAFDPDNAPVPPQFDFEAIWDTGATASAISKKVIQAVGLKPTGMTQIQAANDIYTSNTFLISMRLPNKVGFSAIRVSEGNFGKEDVLIGMDIIASGDFAITNYQGKTVFTYRTPSTSKIDFVEEINRFNQSQMGKVGRNQPCPCGSGKKYKKCHGTN